MKKVLVLLSLSIGLSAFGQNNGQQDFSVQQAQNQEIYLHFDKPFYLSGETVWYSLYNTTADSHRLIFGRRFMELALVDRNKQIVIKERIKVEDGRSAGQLQLPSYLTSGHYMLVITYPFEEVDNFLYRKLLPVYNPEEVRSASPVAGRQIVAPQSAVNKADSDYITLLTSKRNYGPRERVSVTMNLKGFDQASLSVVVREKGMALEKQRDIRSIALDPTSPEVAATLTGTELTNYREKKPLNWNLVSSHGLLLYELLQLDSLTENSIPYAYVPQDQVALSIFEVRPGQFVLDGTELPGGNKSFYFNNFTFNKRLINNMTFWSERDMADNMGEMDFSWIVRPRDYGKVLDPQINQTLRPSGYVADYTHRRRIREDIYAQNAYVPVPDATGTTQTNRMMYQPIYWRNTDDYSEMASLPEFLKEILGGMKVWDTPRKKDVRLSFSGGRYNSQPLFLINGIPTLDIERAFEIPMTDIKGIGVIKDPQNQTQRDQSAEVANFGYFGSNGIIVVHLRDGAKNPFETDFNHLLNTRLYLETQPYPQPDYNRRNIESPSPDFRPVLYWEPVLNVNRARGTFDFYTSDDVGVYEIIVEGIGQNGEVIHTRQDIVLGNAKLFSGN